MVWAPVIPNLRCHTEPQVVIPCGIVSIPEKNPSTLGSDDECLGCPILSETHRSFRFHAPILSFGEPESRSGKLMAIQNHPPLEKTFCTQVWQRSTSVITSWQSFRSGGNGCGLVVVASYFFQESPLFLGRWIFSKKAHTERSERTSKESTDFLSQFLEGNIIIL